MADDRKVRICGLWVQTNKDGDKYMAGNFSPTSKLLLFKNKNKKKDNPNDPDYILYIAPKEPKPASPGNAPKDDFMG